jgi:hypothetical protein
VVLEPGPSLVTPAIEIDRSQNGLVIVRFHTPPTDQQFQQYLADYAQLLMTEAHSGAVFVMAPQLPLPPPRHVRYQARFIQEHRRVMSERLVGVAFSIVSALMRSVLRGILMLQPLPCPHVTLGSEAEGVSWVKARLWAEHVKRMKSAGT